MPRRDYTDSATWQDHTPILGQITSSQSYGSQYGLTFRGSWYTLVETCIRSPLKPLPQCLSLFHTQLTQGRKRRKTSYRYSHSRYPGTFVTASSTISLALHHYLLYQDHGYSTTSRLRLSAMVLLPFCAWRHCHGVDILALNTGTFTVPGQKPQEVLHSTRDRRYL